MEVFMDDIKDMELKDLRNLINNIKDNTIISVDLTLLSNDKNVTESVTTERGGYNDGN